MLAYFACSLTFAAEADGQGGETAAKQPDKKGIEFFEKKIRPVLVQHCYECHSAESKKVKGGLLLDSRAGWEKGGDSGAAVVAGNSTESLLIEAVKYEGLEMPPKGKLPESVIADLVKWVEMGAPDPRDAQASQQIRRNIDIEEGRQFWAFQPPRATKPPKVKAASWLKDDIDRFVLATLEAQGLKPVPDADRRTWIRRVTFDLIGLPPTVEDIEAFVQDSSPNAPEKVVDRLLASPQFGERWGRHWLDIARYAESTGKERNIPFNYAWRYRDYVIDAFNADKPYDRFLQEQIAGDLLPADSPEQANLQRIATGFLALGPKGVNERNAEQYKMDEVDEQIDVVGRAVLGVTIGCARCHDHKFDPIPSADYYALAGIFRSTETYSGVRRGSRNAESKELMQLASDEEQEQSAPAANKSPSKADQKKAQKLRSALEEAQAEFEKTRKQATKAAKKNKDKNDKKEQQRKLAAELRELKKKIARLVEELSELGVEAEASHSGALAMGASEGKVADCHINIRGEVNDLGDEVPRGLVRVLTSGQTVEIPEDQSGRLQLAAWLTERGNPLTARVMVNRVWQHLFGTGLVETVDNFGALGERPTHPELLDHLAIRFMDEGWSMKRLIKSVVLSRTYRLDSRHDEANYAVDPQNKLLWRMAPRRIDAEALRDAMLAVSGQLDLSRPVGSPVMELASGEIGRKLKLDPIQRPSNHRSVYLPILRGVVPEMLSVFDLADPNLVVGQREVTTVATQALFMMNSPFVVEQAEATTRQLLSQSQDDAARIGLLYARALGRPASDEEIQRAAAYLDAYRDAAAAAGKKAGDPQLAAWSSLCQAVMASAEFRYVY
jgi:mono/diheme cytochrome c family protein